MTHLDDAARGVRRRLADAPELVEIERRARGRRRRRFGLRLGALVALALLVAAGGLVAVRDDSGADGVATTPDPTAPVETSTTTTTVALPPIPPQETDAEIIEELEALGPPRELGPEGVEVRPYQGEIGVFHQCWEGPGVMRSESERVVLEDADRHHSTTGPEYIYALRRDFLPGPGEYPFSITCVDAQGEPLRHEFSIVINERGELANPG